MVYVPVAVLDTEVTFPEARTAPLDPSKFTQARQA